MLRTLARPWHSSEFPRPARLEKRPTLHLFTSACDQIDSSVHCCWHTCLFACLLYQKSCRLSESCPSHHVVSTPVSRTRPRAGRSHTLHATRCDAMESVKCKICRDLLGALGCPDRLFHAPLTVDFLVAFVFLALVSLSVKSSIIANNSSTAFESRNFSSLRDYRASAPLLAALRLRDRQSRRASFPVH